MSDITEDEIAKAWNAAVARRVPWNHGNLSAWSATSFREFARLFAQGVAAPLAARLRDAEAENARLREDAARLDYVLTLLMGRSDVANLEQLARLMELVAEAADGRAAIDAARVQEARDDD